MTMRSLKIFQRKQFGFKALHSKKQDYEPKLIAIAKGCDINNHR